PTGDDGGWAARQVVESLRGFWSRGHSRPRLSGRAQARLLSYTITFSNETAGDGRTNSGSYRLGGVSLRRARIPVEPDGLRQRLRSRPRPKHHCATRKHLSAD